MPRAGCLLLLKQDNQDAIVPPPVMNITRRASSSIGAALRDSSPMRDSSLPANWISWRDLAGPRGEKQ